LQISQSQPENAYVAVYDKGSWYSIPIDDKVSKLNFALLAQLMTMQAIPSPSPPLTPSLSVGGRS
jgi:hypothetical protein